jgi:hypothetical protein
MCLSLLWRSGRFWCQLVQLTQRSGCHASLFAAELGEDFFNTLSQHEPKQFIVMCIQVVTNPAIVQTKSRPLDQTL